MFQDELQRRAHDGDQSAFRDIYSRYSREVYAVSHTALGNADSARTVVKQVFLQLYRELMRTEADLDLPARLSALINEEIRITRIASGDLDPNALLVQYTISSAPAAPATDTMDRIRAHMQQSVVAEEPAAAAEPAEAEPQQAAEFDSLQEGPSIEDTFAETFEASSADEPEPAAPETPADVPQPEPEATPAEEASAVDTPVAETLIAPRKSRKGSVIAGFILAILLVLFAWLLAGILMDLEILPFMDLGYSLFNEYVFEFFRLG